MQNRSIYIKLENRIDEHYKKLIKKQINKLPGIESVSVNTNISRISVDYDNTAIDKNRIKSKMDELGFDVSDISFQIHQSTY